MELKMWVWGGFLTVLPMVVPPSVAQEKPVITNQTLLGRLGSRYQVNIDYLQGIYDRGRARMLAPYQDRAGYRRVMDWDGEYAGKWLDAAAKIPASASPELRREVDEFAVALRATQDADGYLGIDSRERRGRAEWDVWNQWYAITGLLTHYEQSKDRASLEAATKAAHWLVTAYGPIDRADHPFFKAAHRGGCNVDVIDQLVRLHSMAPDPEVLAFVRGAVSNFADIRSMEASGRALLVHPYVLFAYLGGVVELARFNGPADGPGWVKSVWSDVVANHLYPTGSMGIEEFLTEKAPNDEPDANHQETCATVEWILLNERLYGSTGQSRYVNQIENSIYNALLAAQAFDGSKWCYYTPLRYLKKFGGGPTECCYWSGPRGLVRLPDYVYSAEPGGLRIDLFEASTANARFGERTVQVRQHTAFPAEGRVLVEVGADKPVEFALAIRAPEWARALAVQVNGKPLKGQAGPDGYLRIRRRWRGADKVSISFEIPATLRGMGAHGSAVARGPEVLSLDSRDNPAVNLDEVVLPAGIVLHPAAPDAGRRRYRAAVMVAGKPRDVIFTPYADAGNARARFRTVFPVQPGRK